MRKDKLHTIKKKLVHDSWGLLFLFKQVSESLSY